jgi:hypothetical protein
MPAGAVLGAYLKMRRPKAAPEEPKKVAESSEPIKNVPTTTDQRTKEPAEGNQS